MLPRAKVFHRRTTEYTLSVIYLFWMYYKVGYPAEQCSGSGSTCFWASRIRIRLSEVWIRIWIRLLRLLILLSSCKNTKKNLDSYYLWLFSTFYLWKIMLMYLQTVISRKNVLKKIVFLLASWRSMTKKAGSGSRIRIRIHVRCMDPRIRIRIHPKMSWIRIVHRIY